MMQKTDLQSRLSYEKPNIYSAFMQSEMDRYGITSKITRKYKHPVRLIRTLWVGGA